MTVSLLIPTIKPEIKMLHSNKWRQHASQFLSTETKGLSKARNELASKASGKILIFADDDATLTDEGWELVTNIKPHEICMTEGRNHPISRVMSVHADTFWNVGGFDESIIFNGEDLDFYLRAVDKYQVIQIPKEHVIHKEHKIRQPYRCQIEAASVRVKHDMITPQFFVQKNPINSALRFIGYVNAKYISQPTPNHVYEPQMEESDPVENPRVSEKPVHTNQNDLEDVIEVEN